jgi:hypothetical protein
MRADNHIVIPTGTSNIRYIAAFNGNQPGIRLCVELNIYLRNNPNWSNAVFDYLEQRRAELGPLFNSQLIDFCSPLRWQRRDDANASCISVYRDDWSVQQGPTDLMIRWAVVHLWKFERTFRPVLQAAAAAANGHQAARA